MLVTGRPPRWLPYVADRIGHRGLAICSNGALVYDLAAERVVETYPIEASTVAALVDQLRAGIPDASFAVEDHDGMRHEAAFPLHWDAGAAVGQVGRGGRLVGSPAAKLLLRDPSGDPDGLLVRADRDRRRAGRAHALLRPPP